MQVFPILAAIVVKENATFCNYRRLVLKSAFKSQTGNNNFITCLTPEIPHHIALNPSILKLMQRYDGGYREQGLLHTTLTSSEYDWEQ